MADEMKQIQVLLGPYRDHRLTVSAADAQAAINDHWAVDPYPPPPPAPEPGKPPEPEPPLTDEQRQAALTAAQTWAQAQWDLASGTPTEKRDRNLNPEQPASGGEYVTRQQATKR